MQHPTPMPFGQSFVDESEMSEATKRALGLMPKIQTEQRSLLHWRKPSERRGEPKDSICVAEGFGGQYAIQADLDKFIVWLDDDGFSFKTFSTVEKCKRYAECRFQHKVRKLHAKLKGEKHEDVEQDEIKAELIRMRQYVMRKGLGIGECVAWCKIKERFGIGIRDADDEQWLQDYESWKNAEDWPPPCRHGVKGPCGECRA